MKNIHTTKTIRSKDIANILFSLGKLHFSWESAPKEVREVLLESLGSLVVTMQSFDVESVFTGLGLMQVVGVGGWMSNAIELVLTIYIA